ncbi:MAG: Hpt domain-containing protein [Pseudomonadota bacterium]
MHPDPLFGRVLLLADAGELAPALEGFGLRCCATTGGNDALHAIIAADVAMDPFQLVIGADAALAAGLSRAPLLAPPRLLPMDAGLHGQSALRHAVATAFAPPVHQAELRVAGVNVAAGLANVGGDRPFYLKLLDAFYTAQRDTGTALSAHYRAQHWPDLARRSHALRGSAAGIGAQHVQEAAAALELQVKLHGQAEWEQYSALQEELERVLTGLRECFASLAGEAPQAAGGLAQARAAQERLILMLGQFDGDSLDVFAESKACLGAAFGVDVLAAIEEHLQRYEFDAARALLDLPSGH